MPIPADLQPVPSDLQPVGRSVARVPSDLVPVSEHHGKSIPADLMPVSHPSLNGQPIDFDSFNNTQPSVVNDFGPPPKRDDLYNVARGAVRAIPEMGAGIEKANAFSQPAAAMNFTDAGTGMTFNPSPEQIHDAMETQKAVSEPSYRKMNVAQEPKGVQNKVDAVMPPSESEQRGDISAQIEKGVGSLVALPALNIAAIPAMTASTVGEDAQKRFEQGMSPDAALTTGIVTGGAKSALFAVGPGGRALRGVEGGTGTVLGRAIGNTGTALGMQGVDVATDAATGQPIDLKQEARKAAVGVPTQVLGGELLHRIGNLPSDLKPVKEGAKLPADLAPVVGSSTQTEQGTSPAPSPPSPEPSPSPPPTAQDSSIPSEAVGEAPLVPSSDTSLIATSGGVLPQGVEKTQQSFSEGAPESNAVTGKPPPSVESTAPEIVKPGASGGVKRQPKGATRADVERELMNIGDLLGPDEAYSSEKLQGESGRISGTNLTFYKKLPEKVKTYIEGNPAARRHFRVTDDPGKAGGSDALSQMGEDRYFAEVDRFAGNKLNAAKKLARESQDPRHQILAAVHDKLTTMPAKNRPQSEMHDPANDADGTEFEMLGHKITVMEDADGIKILKDGDEFPIVPAEAVGQLPIDKGTVREAELPAVDGEFAPSDVEKELIAEGSTPEQARQITSELAQENRNAAEKGTPPQNPAGELPAASESRNLPGQGAPDRSSSGGTVRPEQITPVAEQPPQNTSARKAMMAQDREALGLDKLDSPERRSWQTAFDTARAQGIPDKAMRIASEVNQTPRALSDIETAGVVDHAVKLKNEHAAVMDEIGKATDKADIQTRSAEAHRIEQEFDALSTALKSSGTEKGRALASQKLTLNQDFQLVSVLNRAKSAKGDALKPAERSQFESMTKQLDQANTRVAELEKQVHEQTAEQAIRKSKRGPKIETIDMAAKVARLRELLAAGCKD